MAGGKGNDTYVVDSTGDTATELASEGTDLVQSSVSFVLGANVENLTLTGAAAINATGNTLANALIGNAAANITLSKKRAEAIRAVLVKNGVAAKRLIATGFGPTRPRATNKTAAGREQNRRVEFLVLNKEILEQRK